MSSCLFWSFFCFIIHCYILTKLIFFLLFSWESLFNQIFLMPILRLYCTNKKVIIKNMEVFEDESILFRELVNSILKSQALHIVYFWSIFFKKLELLFNLLQRKIKVLVFLNCRNDKYGMTKKSKFSFFSTPSKDKFYNNSLAFFLEWKFEFYRSLINL